MRGNAMDDQVHLNVPPEARTAKLLTRHRRWGVYYRSMIGDVEGRVEFRQIDPEVLSADQVDPTDTAAVVTHVERQLHAAGFDTTRRPSEGEPVAAAWDIHRRDDTPPRQASGSTESAPDFTLLGAGLRPPRQDRR